MRASKKKTCQELRERTVKSFLDFLVLVMLTKNPSMSGDSLRDHIHQKFGVSISLGLLYSHLFHLEQDRLILRDNIEDKRVCKITQKGKEKIDIAKKNRSAIQWVIDRILEG